MKPRRSIGGTEVFMTIGALIFLVSFLGAAPKGIGSADRALEVLRRAPSATDHFLERAVHSGSPEVLQATFAPQIGASAQRVPAVRLESPLAEVKHVASAVAQSTVSE